VFLCRALNELGDFNFERGKNKDAFTNWSDCVDACFGIIDAMGMR